MGSDPFRDWVRAREDGGRLDLEEHLAQAGAGREELARRIDAYEKVFALATRVVAERRAAEPRTLADFEILGPIGTGGLSKVWLANDRELSRKVALKELDVPAELAPNQRDWVRNEARSLARLTHPGVVRVFQLATDRENERDWLVMELLTGPTLGSAIAALRTARERPDETELDDPRAAAAAVELAPWRTRLRCLAELAEALAYCHACGILHRDVKPNNVILADGCTPKLIDFGLAHIQNAQEETKLDITQRLVGAPAYVAPEQVENDRTGADPKSDQFSFGVVAYELLTLTNPFARATRSQTLDAIAHARPPAPKRLAPELSADLERVLLHMLERDPDLRYPDLAAAAADLRAVLEHRPVSVRAPSPWHRASLLLRRHRGRIAPLLAGLAGIALLVLAGSFIVGLKARGLVTSRLAELAEPGEATAEAFLREGLQLLDLRARALELDESFLASLIGTVGQHVARGVEGWSRELRAALGSALEERGRQAHPFDARTWMQALAIEQELWPECPDREGYWRAGSVVLPPELEGLAVRLYRQVRAGAAGTGAEAYALFQPVPWNDRPVPGYYRLLAYRSETQAPVYQVEFLIEAGWNRERRLSVSAPHADAFALAVPHERTAWREELRAPQGMETVTIDVPAFRLSRELVTLAEFERYLEETGAARPGSLPPAGEHPGAAVVVTHEEALAYATWAGARLPTAVELYLAAESGVFDPRTAVPGIYCEWVSERCFREEELPAALVHARLAHRIWNPHESQLVTALTEGRHGVIRLQTEGAPHPGSGFRLAWSTEPAG